MLHHQNTIALKKNVEKKNVPALIGELAMSLLTQVTVEEILWATARTLSARLGLDDLVVYITDVSGEHLVQRSAFGKSKNPYDKTIENKLKIAIGEGIVGAVAATGDSMLLNDASTDPRYIVDDAERLAELAVPILARGRVLGVIDSEHEHPGFFTDEHREVFEAVANMIAPRILDALEVEKTHQEMCELRRRLHACTNSNPAPVIVSEPSPESKPKSTALIPADRPVMGSDLKKLHSRSGLSRTKFCGVMGISVSAYSNVIKSLDKRIDNVALALEVRLLDAWPGLDEDKPALAGLINILNRKSVINQTHLAILLGRDRSSISTSLDIGQASALVDSLAGHLTALIAQWPDLIEDYMALVDTEAKTRGIDDIWRTKSWT